MRISGVSGLKTKMIENLKKLRHSLYIAIKTSSLGRIVFKTPTKIENRRYWAVFEGMQGL